MQEQFVLEFGHAPGHDAQDFFMGESNREAARLIDAWPRWPSHACLIAGPAGSGKTHLVSVWRERAGAEVHEARRMDESTVAALTGGRPLAVEDVDRGPLDERALFHLLNLAREKRFHVLFTARSLPGAWNIALPDLRSRFRSMAVVRIGSADDQLLKAILVKQFSDRQLRVPPDVIDYLARRIERSTAAAAEAVALIDRASLMGQKRITRHFAAQILGRLDAISDEEPDEEP